MTTRIVRSVAGFLTIAVAVSFLALVTPEQAEAYSRVQNPTSWCATTTGPHILVYESADFQNDAVWLCTDRDLSDLRNLNHALSGDCQSFVYRIGDTWNDCISSVQWWLPAGWKVELWTESGYRGGLLAASACGARWNAGTNLDNMTNDFISSIRFVRC